MTLFFKVLFRKRLFPLTEIGTEQSNGSFIHLVIGGLGGSLPLAIFLITSQVVAENDSLNSFLALTAASLGALVTNLCLCEYKFLSQNLTSLIYTCYQINGELPSFLIGWSLLLYQISAVAACAKTISSSVDYIGKHCVQKWTMNTIGPVPFTKEAPDFIGVIILLLSLAIFIALDRRRNEKLFRILTIFITIAIIIFFTIVGAINADDEKIFSKSGQVIGIQVLHSASFFTSIFCSSFFMDSRGDSLWKGKPVFPMASIIHVLVTLITCMSVAFVLQLMIHDRPMLSGTVLIEAFEARDVDWARYVMATSIFLCLGVFLLDICHSACITIQNMASERLLFSFLNDSNTSEIKWRSCLSLAILVSLAIFLTPLTKLIESMATGYLILSLILLLCVLHQRYQMPNDNNWQYQPMSNENSISCESMNGFSGEIISSDIEHINNNNRHNNGTISGDEESSDTDIDAIVEEYKEKVHVATVTTLDGEIPIYEPTQKTGNCVTVCITIFCIIILPLEPLLTSGFWLVGCVLILFGIFLLVLINCQPQVPFNKLKFRVPFFPFTASVALGLYLSFLMNIVQQNWIWISIWLASGIIIYIGYGIRHSSACEKSGSTELCNEQIQLRPLPKTSFKSRIVRLQSNDEHAQKRLTQVDTILVSK